MERRVKSSESDGRFRRVRIVTEAARTFRRLPQVARGCRSLKEALGSCRRLSEAAGGCSRLQDREAPGGARAPWVASASSRRFREAPGGLQEAVSRGVKERPTRSRIVPEPSGGSKTPRRAKECAGDPKASRSVQARPGGSGRVQERSRASRSVQEGQECPGWSRSWVPQSLGEFSWVREDSAEFTRGQDSSVQDGSAESGSPQGSVVFSSVQKLPAVFKSVQGSFKRVEASRTRDNRKGGFEARKYCETPFDRLSSLSKHFRAPFRSRSSASLTLPPPLHTGPGLDVLAPSFPSLWGTPSQKNASCTFFLVFPGSLRSVARRPGGPKERNQAVHSP